jgi:hypothetical protein
LIQYSSGEMPATIALSFHIQHRYSKLRVWGQTEKFHFREILKGTFAASKRHSWQ